MNKKVRKVRKIVKKECETSDWDYHLKIVVKYANILAEELNANEEEVELAALLHDIGRFKFGVKEHEKTGARKAEKILKKLDYPQNLINKIKHAVQTHRGADEKPESLTAEIVMNADGISHFDVIPFLLNRGFDKYEDFTKGFKWVYKNVERWNDKITLKEAEDMIQDKYTATKIVLDSMKENMQYQ